MRIAFDGRDLATPTLRGMTRYLLGLLRELQGLGVELSLLTRRRERPLHAPHLAGLVVDVVELEDAGGLSWEQVSVPRHLARAAVQLYHAPCERGVPLRSPCPALLTLHSATLPSYLDLIRTGSLPGPLSRYLPGARRRSLANLYWTAQLHRASHVLTPSEFSRGEITRFFRLRADRVSVTPLGLSPEFLRPKPSPEALTSTLVRLGVARPYVLYVGGYEPHKNVDGLLRAFALLRRRRPDLHLVLVGSGPPARDLLDLAERLQVADRTRFLAALSQELPELYDGAGVFASLSWRESFGLPVLEAMARGLGAVVSAWGASREVVEPTCATLVDPRREDAAAAALDEELARPDREERSRVATTHATGFSWSETARKTLAVYERVLQQRRRWA